MRYGCLVNKTKLGGKRQDIMSWVKGVGPSNTRKKEEILPCCALTSIAPKRPLFQPGHKNSENLFVLDVSRERMVSNKVIHRYERKGRLFRIGPRSPPVSSSGVGVVIERACLPRFGDNLWSKIIEDGWQVSQNIGRPWHVSDRVGAVVHASHSVTGRDREIIPVMIVTRCWSVTAAGRQVHQLVL